MSTEENKAVVRRVYEEFNKGNLAAVDELVAANYVDHIAGMEDLHGPEELKQLLTTFLGAFPDYHVTVEDVIAEGDKVVARYTGRGTHKGEFMGIAATGKQVMYTAITILRIEGGKVVEEWPQMDMLGMMQQLGAIPS